jgi:hypothetical protein
MPDADARAVFLRALDMPLALDWNVINFQTFYLSSCLKAME